METEKAVYTHLLEPETKISYNSVLPTPPPSQITSPVNQSPAPSQQHIAGTRLFNTPSTTKNDNTNNSNNNNNNNDESFSLYPSTLPPNTCYQLKPLKKDMPFTPTPAKRDMKSCLSGVNTSCSTLDGDTIYLFVSGKTFSVTRSALLRFPTTKLGQLAARHDRRCHGNREYVFDRNSKIVATVLDFYRTGELHLPTNLCPQAIRRELIYWGIPDDVISECCYGRYKDAMREVSIVDELDRSNKHASHPAPGSCREWIWNVMEKPGINSFSWVWLGVYVTMIMTSVVLVCVSTVRHYRVDRPVRPEGSRGDNSIFENLINTKLDRPLAILDKIGLVFFTVEPLVRLWACPDYKAHLSHFLNLLDFLLALDHWMCLVLEGSDQLMNDHRSVRIFNTVMRGGLSLRVLRLFHLTRKNVKTKVLLLTFRASLMDIFMLLMGLSIAVMVFATLIFYAEMVYDSDNFHNIPQAVWWAIITMTTVGYGDFYPSSVPGYVVGVGCALCGLLLLSMPIAVTATNFNTYYSGLTARDQRQRRAVALAKWGFASGLNHKSDSKKTNRKFSTCYSSAADTIKKTTEGGTSSIYEGSTDEMFWFDDFRDEGQGLYLSDSIIERRHLTPGYQSNLQSSPLQTLPTPQLSASMSSLQLGSVFERSLRTFQNSSESNALNSTLKSTVKTPISTLTNKSVIKRHFVNYNALNTPTHTPVFNTINQHRESVKKGLGTKPVSFEKIKLRKRKQKFRRKAKGSLPVLDQTKQYTSLSE